MFELKPGSTVTCTITKIPTSAAGVDTLERLMGLDPVIQRGRRRAQRRRRQDMVIYNRGNRDWYKRETVGKFVTVKVGQSWSMVYSHQLAGEFESLKPFVAVK